MSDRLRWHIVCDHPDGCNNAYSYASQMISEIRAKAWDEGWAYLDQRDYCPKHWRAAPATERKEKGL